MIKIYLSDEVLTITDRNEEKKWKRLLKKTYRHDHGRGGRDRLLYSMQDRPRVHYDEDCDTSWDEYGFFDGTGMTDDEVREFIDEYIREVIYSPYDCTGKRFTMWVDWHRNPCGLVSYINHLGLDV